MKIKRIYHVIASKIIRFFTWYVVTILRTTFIDKSSVQLHYGKYIIHFQFKNNREIIIAKRDGKTCSDSFMWHKTIFFRN